MLIIIFKFSRRNKFANIGGAGACTSSLSLSPFLFLSLSLSLPRSLLLRQLQLSNKFSTSSSCCLSVQLGSDRIGSTLGSDSGCCWNWPMAKCIHCCCCCYIRRLGPAGIRLSLVAFAANSDAGCYVDCAASASLFRQCILHSTS